MQSFHMEVIGLAAGICTTVSFIPQIVKIVKSKHARDISLWMYVILTMGIFLWLVYGILSSRISIILANGVSFLLCSFIITSKMKYRR